MMKVWLYREPLNGSGLSVFVSKLKIKELEEYAEWLENLPRSNIGRRAYHYSTDGCVEFEFEEDAIMFKLRFGL